MTRFAKILLSLILAIVVIVGYFSFKPNKATDVAVNPSNEKTEESLQVEDTSTKKMPFSSFIKQDGSYKCTVNQSVGGAETKGITYTNKGMIRGEYNTEVNDALITSTFVVRDGYTYSWSSMMPSIGFKSKVIENNSPTANTSTSGTYSFNAEQIGDYECLPWTADDTMFVIPTSVTFREV